VVFIVAVYLRGLEHLLLLENIHRLGAVTKVFRALKLVVEQVLKARRAGRLFCHLDVDEWFVLPIVHYLGHSAEVKVAIIVDLLVGVDQVNVEEKHEGCRDVEEHHYNR